MATLPLGDIDLYWERRGDGPRLLFLNGSASTIESSGPLIDAFARQGRNDNRSTFIGPMLGDGQQPLPLCLAEEVCLVPDFDDPAVIVWIQPEVS